MGVAAGCNTGASCVSDSERRHVPRTSWWQLALVTKFAVLDSTGKLERTAAGQLAPLNKQHQHAKKVRPRTLAHPRSCRQTQVVGQQSLPQLHGAFESSLRCPAKSHKWKHHAHAPPDRGAGEPWCLVTFLCLRPFLNLESGVFARWNSAGNFFHSSSHILHSSLGYG